MQSLADSGLSTLQDITIRHEPAWFADGREDCINPLLLVLAR